MSLQNSSCSLRGAVDGVFCQGIAALIVLVAALPLQSSSLPSPDRMANQEVVRRQANLISARKWSTQGDWAMRDKDYPTAYSSYLKALQLISIGPATTHLRQRTIGKFSFAALQHAHRLIQDGYYADAKKVTQTVLLPKYNPHYRPAIVLLSRLEQPGFLDKTVTPTFAADRNEVVRLLVEAHEFHSAGHFDLAHKRYEQVLNIDPYNIAARRGEEHVHRSRSQYYQQAFNEDRARLLWKVTQAWERPMTPSWEKRSEVLELQNISSTGTEEIRSKLNSIILPKIEFRGTTIRDAIDLLKQRSRELDTTPVGAGRRGVNIVLKSETGGPGLSSVATPPSFGGAMPDLYGNIAQSAPGSTPTTSGVKIDLSLTNIPLYEALRYVSELAGFKLKVDPYAVSVVPFSESTDQLLTREYSVSPSFLPAQTMDPAPSDGTLAPAGASVKNADRDTLKPLIRLGAQEYLQSQGVPFPDGASANYVPAGSRLIVRNTPDALDLIDSIVAASNGAAPMQVQIESKFVSISHNSLKELGFDWLLGPVFLPSGFALSGGGEATTDAFNDPIVNPATGLPIGGNPVTKNLRSGSGLGPGAAVSLNSIDALISQNYGGNLTTGPATLFGISGVLTQPQFQMAIRALSQTKGVDLVSAPKITAHSGQKATIKMIHAFPYPTEFHPPQIPQKGIVAANDVLVNNAFVSQTVTPTTPTRFEVRNTGVTMEVEPVIGSDGFTIDLNLSPEVVNFDGFINYGVPILGVVHQAITGIPSPTVLTQNIIQQPIFSTRKITTSVSVWDGQTVVLGGLMREDVQKVEDKVPLLGDIPWVGRLFRSSADQKIKENLIIFVTARLIDTQGRPFRANEEKDKTLKPLNVTKDRSHSALHSSNLSGKLSQ